MSTNPNAIFGEALATGPRQIPLSELQNQIAQTRQTQAQTANIGSQMAQRQQETIGLQQQNTLRQRQLEDEQAVRDTIAKHTTNIPVTAPNANIPTPGTDSDGNPLPLDLGYHQIAAKGAVQAPHVDYNGAYADLVGQGRFAAAETMLRSIQDRRAKDLENSKAQTALFETQNSRRNELAASVVNAPPEQQAAVAAQVGPQLEQEGLIASGSGVSFGPNDANVLYRSSSGAKDPIRAANAALGLSEAQAKEVTAGARKTAAEAAMSEKELELMNRALSDPTAGTSSIDQLIDPKKYPDINARTKAAFGSAMMFGGPKAAQQVLSSAVTHINTLEEDISKETNPQIRAAKTEQEIAARVGTARAMAGTGWASGILDQSERNKAIEAATKVDEEFADKVGAARQLQDFINLAQQNGNKAVPGMIGIAELKQLVNRVNRNELQAVGAGAGSAWDRIQGFAGGFTAGQPIPPDILRDTKILSGTMENAASRTYDLKRQAIGKNNNIAPPPRINVPASEAAQPAAAPATQFKKGDTVMYQGKAHKVLDIKPNGKLVLEP